MRVIIAAAVLVTIAGCGGSDRSAAAKAWLPAEIVDALKTPDSPYRIIYYPPVDLTKRPAAPK
jgi:hypothetical protein